MSARRRFGDPFMLAFSLGHLASFRSMTGDSAAVAADEAREALALARQTGNPGLISGALAMLAIVLIGTEPEQSRTLITESIELNDALGDVVVDENALVVAFLVSALLGERDQALRLTARGLDRGFSDARRPLRLPRDDGADARPRPTRRRGNAARNHRHAHSRPRAAPNRTGPCVNARPKQSTPNSTRSASASCAHEARQ